MKRFRNPPPTQEDYCSICGKPYAELHEVYFGSDSNISKYYGMQVRLCIEHHRLGKYAPHQNRYTSIILQHIFRYNFINWYDELQFNGTFRKNYEFTDEDIEECKSKLPNDLVIMLEQLYWDEPRTGRYMIERGMV